MRRTKLTRGKSQQEISQMVEDVFQTAREKIRHLPIRLFYLGLHLKMMGFVKKEIDKIFLEKVTAIYKEK